MLTRRGWAVAASSVGFVVAGRLFGILELYILGGVAVTLAGVAVAWVRLRSVRVSIDRTLHPPRVHAGAFARVDLELRNRGSRTTPVLQVRDAFDGGARQARFLAPPLRPGTRSRAAYRLPTDRRGIYDVGPLEVGVADPFGLAAATTEVAGVTQLTVYPRIDRVRPLPHTLGHDPLAGAEQPTALLGPGEDFYGLREYVVGDDTRRVHWKSTARTGDLMIRQDEMPWQNRATIVLDVRRHVHTAGSFELAVSAAASVHEACRRAALVRLVSTDGTDSGFSEGHAHAQAVLEYLASVGTTRHDRLVAAMSMLSRAGNGGAVAVVTTDRASSADLDLLARLRSRFGLVTLVMIERSAWDPGAPPSDVTVRGGVRLVRVNAGQPFPEAWDRAVAPTRVRA